MEQFLKMDGYQFEQYIANLFRNLGFSVEETNYSNDGGVDLVATYKKPIFSGKYIIQCKNWTGSVGQPEVRDLYGVVTDLRANKGILITPSDYTEQAYTFAKGKNIELINGAILKEIISGISNSGVVISASKKEKVYRDDRYNYCNKRLEEEPNVPENYLAMINHLRSYAKNNDSEACTLDLFNELLDWNNKLITRCFKTASKAKDKEMALLVQADTLIHIGNLAEATEIFLRQSSRNFYIRKLIEKFDCYAVYSEQDEKGYPYLFAYTWNLYAAYKYIGYEKGCQLICSQMTGAYQNKSILDMKKGQYGVDFVYPRAKMTSLYGRKTKELNTTLCFDSDFNSPKLFFDRFYTKPKQEYIKEVEAVLKIHGIN